MQVKRLRVVDLREELRKLGLETTGKKDQLTKRLLATMA
jgi:hypothetical protein